MRERCQQNEGENWIWKKNLCMHTSDRGLIFKICEKGPKTLTPNKQNPINKWTNGLNKVFSKQGLQEVNEL